MAAQGQQHFAAFAPNQPNQDQQNIATIDGNQLSRNLNPIITPLRLLLIIVIFVLYRFVVVKDDDTLQMENLVNSTKAVELFG